jgi:hypothetical protein
MDYVIRFLAEFEVPIYLVLGIVALVYLRRVLAALEEKRGAIFGLEREAAQRKVVAATSVLILVGLLTVGEFIVATFLAGELTQAPSFATPTIEVLTTPTTTLAGPVPTDATPTATKYPQAEIEGIESACINDVLEIENPAHLSEITGVVELVGSVNTENFGSYKYEYSTMGEPTWQTIAAGSGTRVDESLGSWYTSDLPAGEYMLRLVALDNDGIEQTACVVVVTVAADQ